MNENNLQIEQQETNDNTFVKVEPLVMLPYYDQDGITIYNADCRTVLDSFAPNQFDLCLTDYPYGVNVGYDGYEDSQQNLKRLIDETMPSILRVSKRAMITCGLGNEQLFNYDCLMILYQPANPSYIKYGHITHQPLLWFGDEVQKSIGGKWITLKVTEASEANGHPCPKPILTWKKVLLRGSVSTDDIILDPFMGSGTTLVAAKQLGRKAVGIEQSQKYCDIAIKRLAQMEMF